LSLLKRSHAISPAPLVNVPFVFSPLYWGLIAIDIFPFPFPTFPSLKVWEPDGSRFDLVLKRIPSGLLPPLGLPPRRGPCFV